MSMPSPFELGAAIGGNISGGINDAAAFNAIDQILQQANETGDEGMIQNAMSQILRRVSPEKQAMAAQLLQNKQAQIRDQRSKQAYADQGLNPSLGNLDPSIQKEIIGMQAKSGPDSKVVNSGKAALDLVKRQKELLKSGHLGEKISFLGTGRKAGSTLSKEGIKARSEYERLGKALISAASNIPIRNKSEFDVISKGLFDPNLKREEIEGNLEAMQRIISDALEAEGLDTSALIGEDLSSTQRPPLSSFNR